MSIRLPLIVVPLIAASLGNATAGSAGADVGIFGGVRDALTAAATKAGLAGKDVHTAADKMVVAGRAEADATAQREYGKAHRALRASLRAKAQQRAVESRKKALADVNASGANRDRLTSALQDAVDADRSATAAEADEVEVLTENLRDISRGAKTPAAVTAAVAASKALVAQYAAGDAKRKQSRKARGDAIAKLLAELNAIGKPRPAVPAPKAIDSSAEHQAFLAAAITKSTQDARAELLKKLRTAIPAGNELFTAAEAISKTKPVNLPKWLKR